MKRHVMRWSPCAGRFIFVVFEECGHGAQYAQYVRLSHLPVHEFKGRVLTCNKNSFFGSREVSLLFIHEHLAQSCYEYINSIAKVGSL